MDWFVELQTLIVAFLQFPIAVGMGGAWTTTQVAKFGLPLHWDPGVRRFRIRAVAVVSGTLYTILAYALPLTGSDSFARIPPLEAYLIGPMVGVASIYTWQIFIAFLRKFPLTQAIAEKLSAQDVDAVEAKDEETGVSYQLRPVAKGKLVVVRKTEETT